MERSLTRDQERSLWLHHAVAGQVVLDPTGILERARLGLVHLRAVHSEGPVTELLQEWGQILGAGPSAVLETLTSRDPRAVELR